MRKQNWTDEELLSRLFNYKSVRSRWDSIGILRNRPSDDLFRKCLEFTRSNDPKIRSIAVDILAQLGTPRPFLSQTLTIFFDLLDSETDPTVLMSLLFAIGHNNAQLTRKQIDKLCSFSATDSDLVKEGLVAALLGIDRLRAIETLITLSSDKRTYIRDWATFGIGTLIKRNNKNIRDALWKRVNDRHQETRFEAIVGLALRNDERVKDIIKLEITGGKYGTLLFEAILETREKDFLPLLRHDLKRATEDKTINPMWKDELKNCIEELTKLTKGKIAV
jgi:hypothetical protein